MCARKIKCDGNFSDKKSSSLHSKFLALVLHTQVGSGRDQPDAGASISPAEPTLNKLTWWLLALVAQAGDKGYGGPYLHSGASEKHQSRQTWYRHYSS